MAMRAPFTALEALVLAILLFVVPAVAFAGATPLEFSPDEISRNLQNAKKISESAAACLSRTWDSHNKFFTQRGYSKYYGNRHPKHKSSAGRKAMLLQLLPRLEQRVITGDAAALKELEDRLRELEETSCVGLSMKCVGEGFEAAGMKDTWQKIYVWLGRKDAEGSPMYFGTDLQKALIDLGWKSLYWNPDLSQNETWDIIEKAMNPAKEGKEWNPVWGGHAYRWALVKRNREYYGVPVHDIQTLVNFGVQGPDDFKKVPFFVGTAHAGYHVFPGFGGNVIEAHSMRELSARSNLEVGPFNPLNQELNGVPGGTGAPRWTQNEHYKSGVIVVPPGFVPDKPFVEPPVPHNVPRTRPPEYDDGLGLPPLPGDRDEEDNYFEPPPRPVPPRRRPRNDDSPFPDWWPRH